jgi:hypothetical protein
MIPTKNDQFVGLILQFLVKRLATLCYYGLCSMFDLYIILGHYIICKPA